MRQGILAYLSLVLFPWAYLGFPEEGLTIGDRAFPQGTILSINPYPCTILKSFGDQTLTNLGRIGGSIEPPERYWMPVRNLLFQPVSGNW